MGIAKQPSKAVACNVVCIYEHDNLVRIRKQSKKQPSKAKIGIVIRRNENIIA
jgi:hypothetical protein